MPTNGPATAAMVPMPARRRTRKNAARYIRTSTGALRAVNSPVGSSPSRAGSLIVTAAATASEIARIRPFEPARAAACSPTTSCFHSRSECSRANSRDTASSAPIRLTATRNASSAESPDASSPSIWSRRCPSSSSASVGVIALPWVRYERHVEIWVSVSSVGAIMRLPTRAAGGWGHPARSTRGSAPRSTTAHCWRCSAAAAVPLALSR